MRLKYALYRGDLPAEYAALVREARRAAGNAYSVYSGFSVGAAVLLNNGVVVRGSNQENMAYPSGLCAERVALFYACSEYPGVGVRALAVVSSGATDAPVTPCGACREVMAEVIRRYGADFEVVLAGERETLVLSAGALLPLGFEMKAPSNIP